jgi:hypothetical protein
MNPQTIPVSIYFADIAKGSNEAAGETITSIIENLETDQLAPRRYPRDRLHRERFINSGTIFVKSPNKGRGL